MSTGRHAFPLALAAILAMAASPPYASAQGWHFTDVTSQANARHSHGYQREVTTNPLAIAAGVAAGDYDNDGWVDLFMVRGDIGTNVLMHNQGDGTFSDRTVEAGLARSGKSACGPLFADLDGDGWLDLIRGGIGNTKPAVFRNQGDGTFVDVTASCGILTSEDTYSIAAGDYDRDGRLDLLTTHWWGAQEVCGRLWRNRGDILFSCADELAGTMSSRSPLARYGFTPNFADINSDGWLDILLASDFGTSQVYLSRCDGTFEDITTDVISDQNGMGSAIGDYDNDGDLDWFVSSIWDLDGAPGVDVLTGNRFYRNDGSGNFEDVTDDTGTRYGWWGWGASFADFDNDGDLDLYHVNGYPIDDPEFVDDPAVLFINRGDGTFSESADVIGAKYLGQGRGIVCFDYDRDGDIDIFVAPANGESALYRNDGGNQRNYLSVKLRGPEGNSEGIGARVYATTGDLTQMRELRAGCNFVSQNPAEAHFGLDDAATVDVLRVRWPDGRKSELRDVAANQRLTLDYRDSRPPEPRVSSVRLLDVGPNPSAGGFTFHVELPDGASGSLVVYDVRGSVVGTVGPFTSDGDTRELAWDGKTQTGETAAVGVYFARVESAAGRSESRRIVVLR